VEPEVSYCVVNTNGREHLLACLAAIEAAHPPGVEREVLVLDNASEDGSADAVRELEGIRLIELRRREGKAANDTALLHEASGRYCLLLNEDSELRPGAVQPLLEALESEPDAAVAGAQLLDPSGRKVPCAWRFPGLGTALVGALFLHRLLVVQSRGEETRRVDWVQSSAMLVRRRAAEEVGYLDPGFFVYYDECDFCRRLHDAGLSALYVPRAEAVHEDRLSTDLAGGLPRIVEFHRNRDRYMRKHHSRGSALAVRVLTAWSYGLRSIAALLIPGQPSRVYLAHARQALLPHRGNGLREGAESYNRRGADA
jgi:GT2 family glycosyltransferase